MYIAHRLKSPRDRFQLSAGLSLEKLNTILSEITIIEPQLKFFKFGFRNNIMLKINNKTLNTTKRRQLQNVTYYIGLG